MIRMHADETPTDASLVRRLVAAQFPDWAELPVVPVPAPGTDNVLYRLGDDMVARLPRRRLDGLRLEQERRRLPRVAPNLPLAVPAPLARGLPGEGYPWDWSIYRWLEGDPATVAPFADLAGAAADLAGFVAALQALDAASGPAPGGDHAFRGEPLVARDASTRAALAKLTDVIDGDVAGGVWEAALEAPEWERPAVWIHGDRDARNVVGGRGAVTG